LCSLGGWSHRPLLALSIGISGYNNVNSGGPPSISQQFPQQFHDWNRTETLVWLGHEAIHTNQMSKPLGCLVGLPIVRNHSKKKPPLTHALSLTFNYHGLFVLNSCKWGHATTIARVKWKMCGIITHNPILVQWLFN
jgi:hypothetical protein